ncbi:unnamed protein product [Ectocarpus sp. 13 AM-2016]
MKNNFPTSCEESCASMDDFHRHIIRESKQKHTKSRSRTVKPLSPLSLPFSFATPTHAITSFSSLFEGKDIEKTTIPRNKRIDLYTYFPHASKSITLFLSLFQETAGTFSLSLPPSTPPLSLRPATELLSLLPCSRNNPRSSHVESTFAHRISRSGQRYDSRRGMYFARVTRPWLSPLDLPSGQTMNANLRP